ncbi:MAG: CBS domain-containing protein [Phaeospirillum sp.]|nr:CBS domain-containing protein [Phaeospirillum sp.]
MKNKMKAIPAKEIMTEELLSVEPNITVQEASELMAKNNIGSLVVLSPIKDLLGIFTERDLLRRVIAKKLNPATTPISAVMTPNVMVAQANDSTWELMEIMAREKFRHLPVVDGRKVVGIISLKDFYNCLLQNES